MVNCVTCVFPVKDENGNLLNDVLVEVVDGRSGCYGYKEATFTGPDPWIPEAGDGKGVLNLYPDSAYHIKFSKSGYMSKTRYIGTGSGGTYTATILESSAAPTECDQHVKIIVSDNIFVNPTVSWGDGTSSVVSANEDHIHAYTKGQSHTVTASATGYTSASTTFTACASQIVLTLTEKVSHCSQNVRVVTSDGGSVRAKIVWGDGASEYATTPNTFVHRFEEGDVYNIIASATGYTSASKYISTVGGCESQFTLTLEGGGGATDTVMDCRNQSGVEGESIVFSAELKTPGWYGAPIHQATIYFSINGISIGSGGTNTLGVAQRTYTPSGPGSYTIKAEFNGDSTYAASSDTGTLTVSEGKGSIKVSSTPSGAQIYLDNEKTGGKTTFLGVYAVTDVSPGSHIVIVKKSGFEDKSSNPITVVAGETVTCPNLVMDESGRTTGSIKVSSTPGFATIWYDGVKQSFTTRAGWYTMTDIPVGDHRVKVTLDGYNPSEERTVTVTSGVTATEHFDLVKIDPDTVGSIRLTSVPGSAQIYIDGVDTGEKTWPAPAGIPAFVTKLDNIPIDERTVTVELAGYEEPSPQTVTVLAGKTSDVLEFKLAEGGPAEGKVYIKSIYPDKLENGSYGGAFEEFMFTVAVANDSDYEVEVQLKLMQKAVLVDAEPDVHYTSIPPHSEITLRPGVPSGNPFVGMNSLNVTNEIIQMVCWLKGGTKPVDVVEIECGDPGGWGGIIKIIADALGLTEEQVKKYGLYAIIIFVALQILPMTLNLLPTNILKR